MLIAGGGFAALEAAFALRALTGDQASIALISPDPLFRYRPASTLEPFDGMPSRAYDLRRIASDLDASYHQTRLESVATQGRFVRLASGAKLTYDTLVLAVGAQPVTSIPGASIFRDQRDVSLVRNLLRALAEGAVSSVAFTVPSSSVWPLPLYELALLCAAYVDHRGVDADISLVTPEREPLAIFGSHASRLIAQLLAQRGVRFVGQSIASGFDRAGSLALQFGGSLRVDRVVTVPQLRGRRIGGVPGSWSGFVRTDALGRVEGLRGVYAAGDMTTFPVKHGGVATQQADRIASAIAASLNAAPPPSSSSFVLQARLVGGEQRLLLHTVLDWEGHPIGTGTARAESDAAHASTKVFGRYLTPYLETLNRSAHEHRTTSST